MNLTTHATQPTLFQNSHAGDATHTPAVHAHRPISDDPPFERSLVESLRETMSTEALRNLVDRFTFADDSFSAIMRRVAFKALGARIGRGTQIAPGVRIIHPESVTIGEGVLLGAYTIMQGRIDGRCNIGNRCWIGPHCFLDARNLDIEEFVGIGPGVKILGAVHTGNPLSAPVIATDLDTRPVRIGRHADIGVNASILPGVTIGEGAIIGAGSVVTRDVPAFTVALGSPCRVVRRRDSATNSHANAEPQA